MTRFDSAAKRIFDIIMAGMGLVLLSPVIMVAFIVASVETKSKWLFRTTKNWPVWSTVLKLVKIKSMRAVNGVETSVTTSNDVRITKSGSFFSKTKIDELPQLWNVLSGNMSFVGPRPDVPRDTLIFCKVQTALFCRLNRVSRGQRALLTKTKKKFCLCKITLRSII